MRKIIVFIVFAFPLWNGLQAQTREKDALIGYGFGAPGSTTGSVTTLHIGGGADWVNKKGWGVGAELGYFAATEAIGEGRAIFSVDAAYHFLSSQTGQKAAPFIAGGYSAIIAKESHEKTVNLGNFGIGVNYWFSEKLGLRVEFRDHLRNDLGKTSHLWGIRIGVGFREVSPAGNQGP
ncbi:MAG: hypothetical protein HY644_02600 [Acidobacteria bacterium]|nr:hypothetical protein [Acidobacteriota bacterium]